MFAFITNVLSAKVIAGTTAAAAIALAFPIYEATHNKVVELDTTINAQQMQIARQCGWTNNLGSNASVDELIDAGCLEAEYRNRKAVGEPISREAFDNLAAQADELTDREAQELTDAEARIKELEAAEQAALAKLADAQAALAEAQAQLHASN